MRKMNKWLIFAMVFALVLGAMPAMAEEEESVWSDLFRTMEDGINSVGAMNQAAAPSGNLIALDDLGVSVRASNYTAVRQDEYDNVYFYAMADGSIPYVMVKQYENTPLTTDFVDDFNDYMASSYSDLKVAGQGTSTYDDIEYTLVIYNYTVNGYFTYDRRLFKEINGSTYMIASKQTPDLGLVLPEGFEGMVPSSLAPLTGNASDYPFHVDSTHSLESSIDERDTPYDDSNSGGNDTLPAGDSKEDQDNVVTTPTEDHYDAIVTFDAATANYTGAWVPFQDGFRLYMPTTWRHFMGTSDGLLYYAFDPADQDNSFLQINWIEQDPSWDSTVQSIDDMNAIFRELGFVVEDSMLINGIPCATYSAQDGAVSGMMFFHPIYGTSYVFNIFAKDYSKYSDLFNTILCSLSLT